MSEYYFDTKDVIKNIDTLKVGDRVYLSGCVYTSRDAAHKRIKALIDKNEKTPYDLNDAFVYYAGPTPTPKGLPIGSCGPTTSSRMDKFAPEFLDLGLKGMIGKGPRNQEVIDAIIRNKAIYFCSVGGAGALASKCIISCEVIAFDDLGCESVKKLEFKDFPLIVAIDCNGNSLF